MRVDIIMVVVWICGMGRRKVLERREGEEEGGRGDVMGKIG